MCGIFGYAGKRINLDLLAQIAVAAEAERGGHAFGFAWVNAAGRLRSYKAAGRLAEHVWTLEAAADAVLLIGHVRWATNGSQAFSVNNHPHPCDGGWIVHNGTVPDHAALAECWGVQPVGYCDSEVLAGLTELAPGASLARRLAWSLNEAGGNRPHAVCGLWARPGRLLTAQWGKPLHWWGQAGNVYLTSLAHHLPRGQTHLFPDRRVCLLTPVTTPKECPRVHNHKVKEEDEAAREKGREEGPEAAPEEGHAAGRQKENAGAFFFEAPGPAKPAQGFAHAQPIFRLPRHARSGRRPNQAGRT